jgi:hypothetical protein
MNNNLDEFSDEDILEGRYPEEPEDFLEED